MLLMHFPSAHPQLNKISRFLIRILVLKNICALCFFPKLRPPSPDLPKLGKVMPLSAICLFVITFISLFQKTCTSPVYLLSLVSCSVEPSYSKLQKEKCQRLSYFLRFYLIHQYLSSKIWNYMYLLSNLLRQNSFL